MEALERQNQQLLEQLRKTEPRGIVPALPDLITASAPTPETICLPENACDAWAAEASREKLQMFATWKNGLELETKNKQFRIHIGGRTQFDGVWLQNNPEAFLGAGGVGGEDAVDFRRARFRIDGTMYGFIEFAAEYDFVNSANNAQGVQTASELNMINLPAPTDLWFSIKDVPFFGNITIGNQKEPIGMEHLASSRYLDFMERSFNQDAFTGPFNNGFAPGIMAWRTFNDDRGLIQTGLFKNTISAFAYGVGDGEYASTSRLSYLFWKEDDGAKLLHLAGSYSLRGTNNGQIQYRSRGSLRNGPGGLNPALVNTGSFDSDQTQMAGVEAALQINSLLLQSEYIGSWNSDSVGNGSTAPAGAQLGTVFVNGWYAEALYFLTGEHRHYETNRGAFGRVAPLHDFRWKEGWGAWQVGVRYSHLDLRDGLMDGGILQDVTVGINWFLNPNLKLQANYVYTDRQAPSSSPIGAGGAFNGFGMRMAHDF